MTYAIVEVGGKQLWVEPGRFYDVNRLGVEEDDSVTLDKVLLIEHEGDVTIGQPFISDASVTATAMRNLRGRKVIVYKMQPKKKTRKKQGHRQELTRIMIDTIAINGQTLASESSTSAASEVASDPVEPEAVATVSAEVVDD
ncbi:MAG: 50S ribosomal protein L21 [Cyanobacteria bacterium P01_A01_bin.123]